MKALLPHIFLAVCVAQTWTEEVDQTAEALVTLGNGTNNNT